MDYKKLSIEVWEEMLLFMNQAQKQYKNKARELPDLDKKIAYYKKAKQIIESRRILISLKYELEEYAQTGRFEPSKIILQKPSKKGEVKL